MRAYGSGDLTPQMAVLGLMSQGRGSVAAIATRLSREFPHANYPRNSAHTGLPRLAEKGHVRLVREGEESSEDLYEITPPGLQHFQDWLHDVAIVPPPLREPLHGKLAFIDLKGIGKGIEMIRVYEDAAASKYGSMHGLVHALSIRDHRGSPSLELDRIRLEYTATLWGQQTQRLTGLREKLEHLQSRLAGRGQSDVGV
jgi:DNA-binding PadR family transcriptional regulator